MDAPGTRSERLPSKHAIVVLPDGEDRSIRRTRRGNRRDAVIGPGGQVNDDSSLSSAAAERAGSGVAPAPRTRASSREAQMRSSARMATRTLRGVTPQGDGRRPWR
jgi:hypothetical protein